MKPTLTSASSEDVLPTLPFDGAPVTPVEPETPDSGDGAPVHELDANPRFRVLRSFHSRYLPDDRDITVYLPTPYLTQPERRFPVFYLHDGQNLFDPRTAYAGRTWQAQRALDSLTAASLIDPPILVGIANTGIHRLAEYTPTRDPRLGGGDGLRYGHLLLDEVKPLIDASLRTLPDRAHTALGGSSLGGLISLTLGLQRPDVFGMLAVVSPSVWWDNRSLLAAVNDSPAATPLRSPFRAPSPHAEAPRPKIWLDMGTAEGLRHLRDADLLYRRLLAHGWRESPDPHQATLRYTRIPGGRHNEDAWAARFPAILQFLFPPR